MGKQCLKTGVSPVEHLSKSGVKTQVYSNTNLTSKIMFMSTGPSVDGKDHKEYALRSTLFFYSTHYCKTKTARSGNATARSDQASRGIVSLSRRVIAYTGRTLGVEKIDQGIIDLYRLAEPDGVFSFIFYSVSAKR